MAPSTLPDVTTVSYNKQKFSIRKVSLHYSAPYTLVQKQV